MTKARDLANAGTALGAVTATELAFVDGVTSAIQTQLDAKQAVVSGVNDTEIGYLDGVTSAVQTQLDAKTAKSTLTTTGDIYYASAANTPARLGIGSTDQVLKVTGGIPAWATPAAGGGMTLLSTTTLSGASTTISGIDQTYVNLYVLIANANSSGATQTQVQFNSDSNQVWSGVEGYDGIAGTNFTSTSYMSDNQQGAGTAVNNWGIMVGNYSQTVTGRAPISIAGTYQQGSNLRATNAQGARTDSTAITSVKISTYSGTWSGGTVKIYGVK
jgi:hypothetical protein